MSPRALVAGLAAGAAGVAAMTLAEKVEQTFTRRPNSYVPAETLRRLVRWRGRDDHATGTNLMMHWGQGILLGAVRGVMSERGLRGPVASHLLLNLRLLNDQLLENVTGAGAPPWTWPSNEQVIDILHKSVYAYVTGLVADLLVENPATDARP
ncbi:MAG: hypothetical protein M3P83_01945 [Actinomycetota bacterium]|nr:hypothetical protein [Actinomycetota bacterium]